MRFVSPVFDLNQITMPPKSIKSFVQSFPILCQAEEKRHEIRWFFQSCCCCTRFRVRDCFVIICGLRIRWHLSALSSETVRGLTTVHRAELDALYQGIGENHQVLICV